MKVCSRFLLSIAALMVLTGFTQAQACFDGSYHSVDSKSSWSNGKFPKDFDAIITIHFQGGKLIYHSINVHNPLAGLD